MGIKGGGLSGGANEKWVVKIGSVEGPKLGSVQRSMLGGKAGAGLVRNEECLD